MLKDVFALTSGIARRRPALSAGAILSLIVALGAQLSIPLVLQHLVDDALIGQNRPELTRLCTILWLASCVAFLFGFLERHLFRIFACNCAGDLRVRIVEHLLLLPLRVSREEHTGERRAVLTSDVANVARFYEHVAREILFASLRLISLVTILLWLYRWAGLLAILVGPTYWCIGRSFRSPIRRRAEDMRNADRSTSRLAQECLAATRELKSMTAEKYYLDLYRGSIRNQVRSELAFRLLQDSASATYIVYWSVTCAIYLLVGARVIEGVASLGMLTALISYASLVQEPFARLVTVSTEWESVHLSATHIVNTLARDCDALHLGEDLIVPARGIKIELRGVSVSYGRKNQALTDLWLTISPGERIAIVGPSGSGKTTLVSLLTRLVDPEGGSIYIDERPINSYSMCSLRTMIGTVLQDTLLFDATIRENILIGRSNATDLEIRAAAIAAGVHSFIMTLSEGYDTRVGERGVSLSAGERQRIGLARVLLRQPAVLILDEATAFLDSCTEKSVQNAVGEAMRGKTSITIAHRLSTIADADRIVVLADGRMIGCGAHASLFRDCSLYRALCQQSWSSEVQMHQSPDAIEEDVIT